MDSQACCGGTLTVCVRPCNGTSLSEGASFSQRTLLVHTTPLVAEMAANHGANSCPEQGTCRESFPAALLCMARGGCQQQAGCVCAALLPKVSFVDIEGSPWQPPMSQRLPAACGRIHAPSGLSLLPWVASGRILLSGRSVRTMCDLDRTFLQQ